MDWLGYCLVMRLANEIAGGIDLIELQSEVCVTEFNHTYPQGLSVGLYQALDKTEVVILNKFIRLGYYKLFE